jgi:hypothetical protein
MALAAYNCIKDINISNIDINSLVAGANLLALNGQTILNDTLIASATTVAQYYRDLDYNYGLNSDAKNVVIDAIFASWWASQIVLYPYIDPGSNANQASTKAAYSARAASYYFNLVGVFNADFINIARAVRDTVLDVYATTYNFKSALTCAAGLIYLNVYTLLNPSIDIPTTTTTILNPSQ